MFAVIFMYKNVFRAQGRFTQLRLTLSFAEHKLKVYERSLTLALGRMFMKQGKPYRT
jgi:hypothetical protein